jgi:hypothetical protein
MSHKIAHIPLDFPRAGSVCVPQGVGTLDPNTLELTNKTYLKEMRERLEQAAGIAQMADACSAAGDIKKQLMLRSISSNSFRRGTPSSMPRA